MSKKFLDNFGKTPRVATALTEKQKQELALDDWFVEYTNTDTRNAIAQGLQLVDHDGDSIFYDGAPHQGFKVSFNDALYLVNSRHMGVYRFIVYHKKPHARVWRVWEMNRKPPKAILNVHSKEGRLPKM